MPRACSRSFPRPIGSDLCWSSRRSPFASFDHRRGRQQHRTEADERSRDQPARTVAELQQVFARRYSDALKRLVTTLDGCLHAVHGCRPTGIELLGEAESAARRRPDTKSAPLRLPEVYFRDLVRGRLLPSERGTRVDELKNLVVAVIRLEQSKARTCEKSRIERTLV